jgi:hypothetical protein
MRSSEKESSDRIGVGRRFAGMKVDIEWGTGCRFQANVDSMESAVGGDAVSGIVVKGANP